jgi:hypothetical protein
MGPEPHAAGEMDCEEFSEPKQLECRGCMSAGMLLLKLACCFSRCLQDKPAVLVRQPAKGRHRATAAQSNTASEPSTSTQQPEQLSSSGRINPGVTTFDDDLQHQCEFCEWCNAGTCSATSGADDRSKILTSATNILMQRVCPSDAWQLCNRQQQQQCLST